MKRAFRNLLTGIVLVLLVIAVFVGPWPVRSSERITYGRPLAGAQEVLAEALDSDDTDGTAPVAFSRSGPVRAGWATVPLVLPPDTPLAGYGDRRGAPNEGYLDDLEAGAVVLSSGDARVAIVSADLLIVPANIARKVRDALGFPVLFSATHTHGGPGAATRGLVARAFGGAFDPEVEAVIVESMVAAVTQALMVSSPVSFTVEQLNREQFIRNRTRDQTAGYPPTDPYLDLVTLETEAQGRLTLIRYSAHATIIPADQMRFSGGYPKALRTAFEDRFGGQAFFLAGAMGSMSPAVPAGVGEPRHQTYAEALIDSLPEQRPEEIEPVSALSVVDLSFRGPPVQLRFTRNLRLSPLFLASQGVDRRLRLTAVRVGSLVLIGFPADLSGEIGAALRHEYAASGVTVIPLSFSGDYIGYLSPDAYFADLRDDGGLAYETGIMSWAGPNQERFFVELARRVIESL